MIFLKIFIINLTKLINQNAVFYAWRCSLQPIQVFSWPNQWVHWSDSKWYFEKCKLFLKLFDHLFEYSIPKTSESSNLLTHVTIQSFTCGFWHACFKTGLMLKIAKEELQMSKRLMKKCTILSIGLWVNLQNRRILIGTTTLDKWLESGEIFVYTQTKLFKDWT